MGRPDQIRPPRWLNCQTSNVPPTLPGCHRGPPPVPAPTAGASSRRAGSVCESQRQVERPGCAQDLQVGQGRPSLRPGSGLDRRQPVQHGHTDLLQPPAQGPRAGTGHQTQDAREDGLEALGRGVDVDEARRDLRSGGVHALSTAGFRQFDFFGESSLSTNVEASTSWGTILGLSPNPVAWMKSGRRPRTRSGQGMS